jgi:hypothetical protein
MENKSALSIVAGTLGVLAIAKFGMRNNGSRSTGRDQKNTIKNGTVYLPDGSTEELWSTFEEAENQFNRQDFPLVDRRADQTRMFMQQDDMTDEELLEFQRWAEEDEDDSDF